MNSSINKMHPRQKEGWVHKRSNILPEKSRPLRFFTLVFALSAPFWLTGAVTGSSLLPGLPVSSVMVICPVVSALILVYGESKTMGMKALLKRSFDFRRIKEKVWYFPVIFLMPGIAVLAYDLMAMLQITLPIPYFQVLPTLVSSIVFFVAALAEELGWSGYAIDPMQDRRGTFQASVLLGLAWATWHIIPFVQADRSAIWITWQCLTLVASRVLIVWLYNNTGKSIFAAALFHSTINISWQLFPNQGSHYDPRITGLITTAVAVIVTVIWGPRTLTRIRNA